MHMSPKPVQYEQKWLKQRGKHVVRNSPSVGAAYKLVVGAATFNRLLAIRATLQTAMGATQQSATAFRAVAEITFGRPTKLKRNKKVRNRRLTTSPPDCPVSSVARPDL